MRWDLKNFFFFFCQNFSRQNIAERTGNQYLLKKRICQIYGNTTINAHSYLILTSKIQGLSHNRESSDAQNSRLLKAFPLQTCTQCVCVLILADINKTWNIEENNGDKWGFSRANGGSLLCAYAAIFKHL